MNEIFSLSKMNYNTTSKWVSVAKIPYLANKKTSMHILKTIINGTKSNLSVYSTDFVIQQYYSNLYFKIGNKANSNQEVEFKVVKEANGDRVIYAKCPANCSIYTQLTYSSNPVLILPIICDIPDKDDSYFNDLQIEDIKEQYPKNKSFQSIRIPYFREITPGSNSYKLMEMSFSQVASYGASFYFKVQDNCFNSKEFVSCNLLVKIWIQDRELNSSIQILNGTPAIYNNYIDFKVAINKEKLSGELYIIINEPWLSLNITPLSWDYTAYCIGNVNYINPAVVATIPEANDNIKIIDSQKLSAVGKYTAEDTPTTTEKVDLIKMINELKNEIEALKATN